MSLIRRKCLGGSISCLLIFLFITNASVAYAFSDSLLLVRQIHIEGNKKTKPGIIERELGFSVGDTIHAANLTERLSNAQRQLINTTLFLEASISYQVLVEGYVDMTVRVRERWYVFPLPVFSLADDNFNVWWSQQMRSLKRVNLGLALAYSNVTGHNDLLNIGFQTGFSNGVGFSYHRPNIGMRKRHGFGMESFITSRREIIINSESNRRKLFRSDDIVVRNHQFKIYYTYRKKINTQHSFFFKVASIRVADTVSILNPEYLGFGRTRTRYMEVGYVIKHIKADNWQYPLKGHSVVAEIASTGWSKRSDIKALHIYAKAGRYIPLGKNWYADFTLAGNGVFSPHLPFIKQQALGYNDNRLLRGLDLFVFNGQGYLLSKNNIKRKVAETKLRLKFLPSQFAQIPLRVFLKTFGDAGYVHSKTPGNNRLLNRWLFTGGFGADVVTYYDASVAVEYGFNGWGQAGFFMRINVGLQ